MGRMRSQARSCHGQLSHTMRKGLDGQAPRGMRSNGPGVKQGHDTGALRLQSTVSGSICPTSLSSGPLLGGIGNGNGRQEAFRVSLLRVSQDVVTGPLLDELALVHDRDPVREHVDDGEVVADEETREFELILEFLQQIEKPSLNRDVERGGRLIGDEHRRAQCECAGNADALPLTTRELMRKTVAE